MTRDQLLNHYRNLYQVVKRDKDEIERELEEYKLLSSMQQDIIKNANKRIENLVHALKVLENNLNESIEFSSELKVDFNSITNTKRVRIN